MPKVELVFFSGCPNVDGARASIKAAGVDHFTEVNQDLISEGDPYRRFSSPTVLVDGEVVVGSLVAKSTCSVVDWSRAQLLISERVTSGTLGNTSAKKSCVKLETT